MSLVLQAGYEVALRGKSTWRVFFHVCNGRLAMPSVRHGFKARHFPFPRRSGGPQSVGAEEKEEEVMDDNAGKTNGQEELLWHFTSTHSLQLIFEKGLLATHSYDLEDGTESLLKNRLLTSMAQIAANSRTKISKASQEEIDSVKQEIEKGNFLPSFTTSFSETPWFPYMWEHYTPKGGFAIGFSKAAIMSLTNNEEMASGKAVKLDFCNYDRFQKECEQVAQLRNAFDVVSKKLREHHPDKSQKVLARAILKNAFPLVFVKQAFYAPELECRLVHILNEEECATRVMVVNKKRRIYIHPNNWPGKYVRRIIVSPKGDTGCNHAIALIVSKLFDIPEECVMDFRNTEFAGQPELLASNGNR